MKKVFTAIGFILLFVTGIVILGRISDGVLAAFGVFFFALAGMVWLAKKAVSWVFPSEKAVDNLRVVAGTLRDENNELRADNEILNKRLRVTQDGLERKESVAETVRQEWEKLCTEKRELLSQKEGLSEENASLLEENASLLETGAELRAENKELGWDNESLQEQVKRMGAQVGKLRKRMRILYLLTRICTQNPGIAISIVVVICMLLVGLFFPGVLTGSVEMKMGWLNFSLSLGGK